MSEKKMNLLRNKIKNSQWMLLCIVIVTISVVTAVINSKFLRINNIMNIFEQISVLGLVAAGATVIIISGNFDISVGAIIGLASCVMAIDHIPCTVIYYFTCNDEYLYRNCAFYYKRCNTHGIREV